MKTLSFGHRVSASFLMSFIITFGINTFPVKANIVSGSQPFLQPDNSLQPLEKAPENNKASAPDSEKDKTSLEQADPEKKNNQSTGETEEEVDKDPLEPLNRLVFAVNDLLDFIIIRPAAEIYRAVLPEPVRNGVTNVLDNLFAPVVFLNHVLQGNPEQATVTVFRFLTNSTFGLLGLVDAASELGYPRYDTNFNETLMTWNIDTGPYLVLPLIGPSSFRGAIGYAGDYYSDPLNIYLRNRHHRKQRYWLTVRYGLDILSHREKLIESLDNLNSSDKYATLKSVYFQRQAYLAEQLKSAKNAGESEENKDPSQAIH